MTKYQYLPQLTIAYKNTEHTELVHVLKAESNRDYYCPCCGQTVCVIGKNKEDRKVQPYYRHCTSECSNEERIQWFYRNWLFFGGSEFYLNDILFKVKDIKIGKTFHTPFGTYTPDITVITESGKEIFFEMFFQNRKTESDYFCKWDCIKNDVIEINVNEYYSKTNKTDIPRFQYLYHNGECFSKAYIKRDLYFNTIAKQKRSYISNHDYESQMEQLDDFWIKIQNNESAESIISLVKEMDYDMMVVCYNVAKKKQTIKYLVPHILQCIDNRITETLKELIEFPDDEYITLSLYRWNAKTYYPKLELNYKNEFRLDEWYEPKIVYNKDIHTIEETLSNIKNISKFKEEIYRHYTAMKEKVQKYIQFKDGLQTLKIDKCKYAIDGEIVNALVEIGGEYYPIDSFNHNYDINLIKKTIEEEFLKLNMQIIDKKILDAYISSDTYKTNIQDLIRHGKNLGLKVYVETKNEQKLLNYLYINGEFQCHAEAASNWVWTFNRFILQRYVVKTGYKYYIDKLNSSGAFKAETFTSKIGDTGVTIWQKISDTENIKPYTLYIRDFYNAEDIDRIFKNAVRRLCADLKNTGNVGFYGEI